VKHRIQHASLYSGEPCRTSETICSRSPVCCGNLDAIARTYDVAPELVRATCLLHRKPDTSGAFWQGWNQLFARMGGRFHAVYAAVSDTMQRTLRSSSMVKNLNSRIRVCLTNRRHLNGGRTLARPAAIRLQSPALRAQPVCSTNRQEPKGTDERAAS